uniref:FBA_2 domain-containing protein n=1 Tax=Caenorhabditis tropicalis TaxID=1561998 RepID=A0A1I7U1D8_9PELO
MNDFIDYGWSSSFEQHQFVTRRRETPLENTEIPSFIEATNHFMDVLNCRIDSLSLELKPPLTEDQLIVMIDCLNGIKTDIGQVLIVSSTSPPFELFMNRIRKSVSKFYSSIDDSERNVHIPLNFEIKEYFSSTCPWLHLDSLLNMNTEKISASAINLSAEDLNVFLRSWQEGKTNRKLKSAKLRMSSERDVKEVLKGCEGQLMDPRTTKLKCNECYDLDFFIGGGIHIRGNDGRLAVIDTNGQEWCSNYDDTYEKRVQKYLKEREIWNSENSAEKWMEKSFFIYIF